MMVTIDATPATLVLLACALVVLYLLARTDTTTTERFTAAQLQADKNRWSTGTVYALGEGKNDSKGTSRTLRVGSTSVTLYPVSSSSGTLSIGRVVKIKVGAKSFYGLVVSKRKVNGFGLFASGAAKLGIKARKTVKWSPTGIVVPGAQASSGGRKPGGSGALANDRKPGQGTETGGGGDKQLLTYKNHRDFVLTWYSFQDNTPSNSSQSSSGRRLIPFVSAAPPFRLLKKFGGDLEYGQPLYVEFLRGRTMPNGMKHSGWVTVDDFCGDNNDDDYCFLGEQGDSGKPKLDLYIGDIRRAGMNSSCNGPAGAGEERTLVYTGTPSPGEFIKDYGGAEKASDRRCGDGKAGQADHAKYKCGFYGGDHNDNGC